MAKADTTQHATFLASLMDTDLYSMGAYFCERHPDLVEDVLAESDTIEQTGLEAYAAREGQEVEACFQTLVTGLAVRYYRAVSG